MNTDCDERSLDPVEETITISCEVEGDRTVEPARESTSTTRTGNRCGYLEVALLYDAPMRKMTVHILQARDLPSRDRGQGTNTQVKIIKTYLMFLYQYFQISGQVDLVAKQKTETQDQNSLRGEPTIYGKFSFT